MKRNIVIITVLTIILTMMSSYIYATEEIPETTGVLQEVTEDNIIVKAKILHAGDTYEEDISGYINIMQDLKVQVIEGEYKGKIYDTKYILSYDLDNKIVGYKLDKGNTVFLQITKEGDEITQIIVTEMERYPYVIYMIIAFLVLIIIIGRFQGLKAILGLIATIIVIYGVMLRWICKGYSPIIASIVSSAIVIVITFIIISGFKKKSFTATIGTTGGVICSGIMAWIFGVMAKLSGAHEEALYLSMNTQNINFNFRELLFAGIVVASLGACMDVGMSISSALDEIKQKNPDITWKELVKSGMNIGRDVIGTMVNTLILAYVGGAITLVLLFMVSDMNLVEILNRETIVADIVSALAGSMGVIFTVPITAVTYALLNKKNSRDEYKKRSDNIVEGKRTIKI